MTQRGNLLAGLFLTRVIVFITRMSIVSFYPELILRYHANYADMGLLYASFFIAYAIGLVPVGLLVDRYRPEWFLMAGVALAGLSLVGMGLAPGFHAALILRGIAGIAVAGTYPAAMTMSADYFPQIMRGRILATLEAAVGIGTLLAISVFPMAAAWVSPFALFAISGMFAAVAVWFTWRGSRDTRPLAPIASSARVTAKRFHGGFRDALGDLRAVFSVRNAVILIPAFLLATLETNGLMGWIPTFLNDHSLGQTSIGLLTGGLIAGNALGALPAGMISDRFRRRRPVLYAGVVLQAIAAAVLWLLPFDYWLVLAAMVMLGVGLAAVMTPLVIWSSEVIQRKYLGLASSCTAAAGQVGSACAGYLFGWLRQTTGSFGAIWVTALLVLIVFSLTATKFNESAVPALGVEPTAAS